MVWHFQETKLALVSTRSPDTFKNLSNRPPWSSKQQNSRPQMPIQQEGRGPDGGSVQVEWWWWWWWWWWWLWCRSSKQHTSRPPTSTELLLLLLVAAAGCCTTVKLVTEHSPIDAHPAGRGGGQRRIGASGVVVAVLVVFSVFSRSAALLLHRTWRSRFCTCRSHGITAAAL